jgi:hypothetical protein
MAHIFQDFLGMRQNANSILTSARGSSTTGCIPSTEAMMSERGIALIQIRQCS